MQAQHRPDNLEYPDSLASPDRGKDPRVLTRRSSHPIPANPARTRVHQLPRNHRKLVNDHSLDS